jgi:hypothetical protein
LEVSVIVSLLTNGLLQYCDAARVKALVNAAPKCNRRLPPRQLPAKSGKSMDKIIIRGGKRLSGTHSHFRRKECRADAAALARC